jgi:hypothetical protein
LNGPHQLLVYVNYTNLLEENMNIEKKKIKASLDASNKIGLEIKHRGN